MPTHKALSSAKAQRSPFSFNAHISTEKQTYKSFDGHERKPPRIMGQTTSLEHPVSPDAHDDRIMDERRKAKPGPGVEIAAYAALALDWSKVPNIMVGYKAAMFMGKGDHGESGSPNVAFVIPDHRMSDAIFVLRNNKYPICTDPLCPDLTGVEPDPPTGRDETKRA
ncbi:hypothetical protein BJX76DRAFT_359629 [Aspergillus varians]